MSNLRCQRHFLDEAAVPGQLVLQTRGLHEEHEAPLPDPGETLGQVVHLLHVIPQVAIPVPNQEFLGDSETGSVRRSIKLSYLR